MVSEKRDEGDDLPDKDVARDFYAKYEPKEILGRSVEFAFLYTSCERSTVNLEIVYVEGELAVQ